MIGQLLIVCRPDLSHGLLDAYTQHIFLGEQVGIWTWSKREATWANFMERNMSIRHASLNHKCHASLLPFYGLLKLVGGKVYF